jgi:hypothetical protein
MGRMHSRVPVGYSIKKVGPVVLAETPHVTRQAHGPGPCGRPGSKPCKPCPLWKPWKPFRVRGERLGEKSLEQGNAMAISLYVMWSFVDASSGIAKLYEGRGQKFLEHRVFGDLPACKP